MMEPTSIDLELLDHVQGGAPNEVRTDVQGPFGVGVHVAVGQSDYATCFNGMLARPHTTPADILAVCGRPPGSAPTPTPPAPAPAAPARRRAGH